MGIYLNQGNELFAKDKLSEIYVDKSGLIEQTNKVINTNNQYISISRPRRFGKSMAAHMLTAYYSCGCDSRELFSGLKIMETESFEKHLNKYNVISIDMQKFLVKTKSIRKMLELMEEKIFKELRKEYSKFIEEDDDFTSALEHIFTASGIPFVFIVDEWDCVLREDKIGIYEQKEYLNYLYVLFKDQPYVALAYMTGILPIKKYGRHSALNMFMECSMENQRNFAEFTGFTEKEVTKLCEKYNMDLNTVKRWYNGYYVRGMEIYNPRSVVLSMTGHDYDNYWTQTETYESLKTPIQLNFDGLREKVEKMLSGEKIVIDTGTFQNDMTSMQSADDVFTLLIHLGYLTYDFNTKSCWIPNQEVADEFVRSIKANNWKEVINAVNQSEECLKATLAGDEKTVARIIEQTHQENTSIIKYNDENSLACIVTLSYYTAKNKYFVIRELPSGKGYADIAFIPRPNEKLPAIVVELKKEKDESIAIAQIKNRQYFDSLKTFSGEIILVGINYSNDKDNSGYKRHTCKIERMWS